MLAVKSTVLIILDNHTIILLLLFLVIIHLAAEAFMHWRNLRRIPIRIHVNGSYGKSTVTRLIAAGLREAGLVVSAKTAGTLPCFIRPDGSEQAIYRAAGTDMLELAKLVRTAAGLNTQIFIIACSAIKPELQSLAELKFIKSTHSIITNILNYRLDVIGPTIADAALAFVSTTSVKGLLYTLENPYLSILKHAAADRQSELVVIKPDFIATIDEPTLANFRYIEHLNQAENIALALKMCQDLGVPREVALKGMWKTEPDPETISTQFIQWKTTKIIFVNAFVINDHEEAYLLWQEIREKYLNCSRRVIIFNCRADRKERSQSFAKAINSWGEINEVLVIGNNRKIFINEITNLSCIDANDWQNSAILNSIIANPTENMPNVPILVLGLGNISGAGFKIFEYFTHLKNEQPDTGYYGQTTVQK